MANVAAGLETTLAAVPALISALARRGGRAEPVH